MAKYPTFSLLFLVISLHSWLSLDTAALPAYAALAEDEVHGAVPAIVEISRERAPKEYFSPDIGRESLEKPSFDYFLPKESEGEDDYAIYYDSGDIAKRRLRTSKRRLRGSKRSFLEEKRRLRFAK